MTVSSSARLAGQGSGQDVGQDAGQDAGILAVPLDAAGFAPFGEVLSLLELHSVSVNEGRGTRRDLPRPVAGPGLSDTVAFYDLLPSALPFRVGLVERHPLTAQLFLPVQASRWLVVVMPQRPDGSPDVDGALAFVAGPDQAISYAPGVWHLPLVALDGPARFIMRMGEGGTPDDCREQRLDHVVHVLA